MTVISLFNADNYPKSKSVLFSLKSTSAQSQGAHKHKHDEVRFFKLGFLLRNSQKGAISKHLRLRGLREAYNPLMLLLGPLEEGEAETRTQRCAREMTGRASTVCFRKGETLERY